jgi:hypothetical protein
MKLAAICGLLAGVDEAAVALDVRKLLGFRRVSPAR